MVTELVQKITVPVVVKGIQHPDDAMQAKLADCKAVWLSNHGGRVNETDQSLMQELVRVRKVVGENFPLVIDGGFRTGSDIAKALLLGATHIAFGRPLIHGLVEDGSRGIESVIRIAQSELEKMLGALGVTDIRDLPKHIGQIGFWQEQSC